MERAGTAATLAQAGADDATRMDDASLVAALRAGDEAAFVELVERYHASLLRLARLYVADGAAAEDVVQETWLGLLRGLDRFEGRATLKTWLFRILVNRARTRAVRDGRTTPFSMLVDQETETLESAVDPSRFRPADDPCWPGHWLLPPSADDLPEARLLATELTERVRAAVATLPPAQREVVTLRDIEGLTSTEVCQLLELSEANQRVLLHRGRSKVRAALEAYLAVDRACRRQPEDVGPCHRPRAFAGRRQIAPRRHLGPGPGRPAVDQVHVVGEEVVDTSPDVHLLVLKRGLRSPVRPLV